MNIEDMPHLAKSLSKAKLDSIRYRDIADESVPIRGTNVHNTVLYEMQGRSVKDYHCGANDIIFGIARLDHQSTNRRDPPLSTTRLYNILRTMPNINTREVMKMLDCGNRQAQKYVKACKIMMPFLREHFDKVDMDDFLEAPDWI